MRRALIQMLLYPVFWGGLFFLAGTCLCHAQLDTRWTVSVLGQSVPVNADGSFVLPNLSAADQYGPGGPGTLPDFVGDDFVRVIAIRTVDGVNQYAFGDFFQVRQGQRFRIADLTFTDVPPRQPERIGFLDYPGTLGVGVTRRLRVVATYADGATNEVSSRSAWTTYRTSNPAVAQVSLDGELTGKAPGTVFVTAMNEGASAVARLRIANDLRVTVVRGRTVDRSGTALGGVSVTVVGTERTVLSEAAGAFVIADVPADQARIAVIAQWTRETGRWIGTAEVPTVPGGTTDVGVVVLAPYRPPIGWIAAGGNPHRGTAATDQGAHTLAISRDRTVWSWGYNVYGQLGNGTQGRNSSPFPTPGAVELGGCRQVAVGGAISHSFALLDDGSLMAWGRNDHGQLGRGNTRNWDVPQPVPGEWAFIAAGGSQSAGIDPEGAIWRWGAFTGRGSVHTSPVLWNRGKRWGVAAVGNFHLSAVTADGELWHWGESSFDGSTVGRLGPRTNWTFVAAGGRHSLALQADGGLWAWGANEAGQLGTGTTDSAAEPTLVAEPGPWAFVAAGENHTLAIKADGTLWSWGGNAGGQLGDGTLQGSPRPLNRLPGRDWVSVAAGNQYSLAIKADGSLCSWGSNGDGQLGLGNRVAQSLPQIVKPGSLWGLGGASGGGRAIP